MLQPNFCLTTIRKADVIQDWTHAFCIDGIMVHHAISMKEGNYIFPLYLYPSEQDLDQTRRGNFDPKLYKRLQTLAKHTIHGTPKEVVVFDYIYGVLQKATSPESLGPPPQMNFGTFPPKAPLCANST